MKSSIDKAKEYADLVRIKLGRNLKQIILFGFLARGDAREGSDFEFLVVVDERTKSVREAVLDAGVEMLNQYDQLFAALLYSEDEWSDSSRYPIGWNIHHEGIAL
ncbi:MAG: nucleotidyltransferase domain-containing protein [Planctomycetes bacterium]|nr:nucleotidyltransferase domain-containing protein [Planctomycetota bacterium]